jgi:uncharacterized protein YukE
MTGLTDSIRANFNLMRDLSQVLHKDANTRANQVKALIEDMSKQKQVQELQQKWEISIDKEPFRC